MKSIVTMLEQSLDFEIIGETSLSTDFSQSFLGGFISLFLCFFRHGVSIDPVSLLRRILGHLPGFLKGEHVLIFFSLILFALSQKSHYVGRSVFIMKEVKPQVSSLKQISSMAPEVFLSMCSYGHMFLIFPIYPLSHFPLGGMPL